MESVCLAICDKRKVLGRWETEKGVCETLHANWSQGEHQKLDHVFRVSLQSPELLEAPIARYSCLPRLRPIPFVSTLFVALSQIVLSRLLNRTFQLLKSRVQKKDNYVRCLIRIRANPTNEYALANLAILLVVPPEVAGESVSMSRIGGWDGMKRTISWTMDRLDAGEKMEIQVQFELLKAKSDVIPNFPILIRCYGRGLFSGIDLSTWFSDGESAPGDTSISFSSRILYRKV